MTALSAALIRPTRGVGLADKVRWEKAGLEPTSTFYSRRSRVCMSDRPGRESGRMSDRADRDRPHGSSTSVSCPARKLCAAVDRNEIRDDLHG